MTSDAHFPLQTGTPRLDGGKGALEKLDARSREIFKRIVESYLETGEPLGSRNLSRIIPMTLSPASVRNVMQDLEEAGLIFAPHTSAGRMPTQTGLRFFVDAMMEFGDLTQDERQSIEAQVAASAGAKPLETLLTEASQMLSGLSRGAGIVMSAKTSSKLKHIEFVRLDPGQALVILVTEDGQVENRIIPLPAGLPQSALVEATNFLNHHISGRTLQEARTHIEAELDQARATLDTLTSELVSAGLASWSGGEDEQRQLIVRGQANLLENLKAMEDLERIRLLFDDLESKRGLIDMLGDAEKAEGVRIFIGAENRLFSLSGSSVVAAPYRDSQQRIVGVLGVIGPTRLNYARIVPMVDYTAKVISRLIGETLPNR